jgi:hypothetical protein
LGVLRILLRLRIRILIVVSRMHVSRLMNSNNRVFRNNSNSNSIPSVSTPKPDPGLTIRLRNNLINPNTNPNPQNISSSNQPPRSPLQRPSIQIPPPLRRRLAKPTRPPQHPPPLHLFTLRPSPPPNRPLRKILDKNPWHRPSPLRIPLFLRLCPHDYLLPHSYCKSGSIA